MFKLECQNFFAVLLIVFEFPT